MLLPLQPAKLPLNFRGDRACGRERGGRSTASYSELRGKFSFAAGGGSRLAAARDRSVPGDIPIAGDVIWSRAGTGAATPAATSAIAARARLFDTSDVSFTIPGPLMTRGGMVELLAL